MPTLSHGRAVLVGLPTDCLMELRLISPRPVVTPE